MQIQDNLLISSCQFILIFGGLNILHTASQKQNNNYLYQFSLTSKFDKQAS